MSFYGDPKPSPACVAKHGLENELWRLSVKALLRDLRAGKRAAHEYLPTLSPEAQECVKRIAGIA